jgi:hypothetical protein
VAYSGLKYPEATWCSGNRTANFDGVKTNKDGKKRFNGLEETTVLIFSKTKTACIALFHIVKLLRVFRMDFIYQEYPAWLNKERQNPLSSLVNLRTALAPPLLQWT